MNVQMIGKIEIKLLILKFLTMGKTGQSGQGNGGGWPSTTGNPSGGGRSNNGSSSSGKK